jgi:hypothetical protein
VETGKGGGLVARRLRKAEEGRGEDVEGRGEDEEEQARWTAGMMETKRA